MYIHTYIHAYTNICIHEHTDTYIQVHMHIAMHTCVYTRSHIYIPSSYSACFTHYVGLFSFGSTKLRKNFQVQRPFLF